MICFPRLACAFSGKIPERLANRKESCPKLQPMEQRPGPGALLIAYFAMSGIREVHYAAVDSRGARCAPVRAQ